MERKGLVGKQQLNWHEGLRWDVAIGREIRELSPYRSKVWVFIRDRETVKVESRVGDCRLMGNFSPIWINWKGKKELVEELLRKGD